jgi:hypothetical protein
MNEIENRKRKRFQIKKKMEKEDSSPPGPCPSPQPTYLPEPFSFPFFSFSFSPLTGGAHLPGPLLLQHYSPLETAGRITPLFNPLQSLLNSSAHRAYIKPALPSSIPL